MLFFIDLLKEFCYSINITDISSIIIDVGDDILFLEINLESEIPIYTQLRHEIIKGIASGELKEGDTLPSVRQMAADLGVNMHTVNKVYNLLKQEGFLSVHRRKGVVVNSKDQFFADETYLKRLRLELKPLVIESKCRGLKEKDIHKLVSQLYFMKGE